MYVCIIQMADDKAVAALRAARRLPPPAWEFIRAILGQSQADPGVYMHSCCGADVWQWAPRDDEEPSDLVPDDPDGLPENNDQGQDVPPLGTATGSEDGQ
jgi:hypothetical protein